MLIDPADQSIVQWAMKHAVPFHYATECDLPGPCLKMYCGHVTAYFSRGRLLRLWAHADAPLFQEMFQEIFELLQLGGQPPRTLNDRGQEWQAPRRIGFERPSSE
jgi:hypothetical protein